VLQFERGLTFQATPTWHVWARDGVGMSIELLFLATPAFEVETSGASLPMEYVVGQPLHRCAETRQIRDHDTSGARQFRREALTFIVAPRASMEDQNLSGSPPGFGSYCRYHADRRRANSITVHPLDDGEPLERIDSSGRLMYVTDDERGADQESVNQTNASSLHEGWMPSGPRALRPFLG